MARFTFPSFESPTCWGPYSPPWPPCLSRIGNTGIHARLGRCHRIVLPARALPLLPTGLVAFSVRGDLRRSDSVRLEALHVGSRLGETHPGQLSDPPDRLALVRLGDGLNRPLELLG